MTLNLHDKQIGRVSVRETERKIDFRGRWSNQMGSRMEIRDQSTNGEIRGSYTTASSGTGQELTAPLFGAVQGDIISFCVNWSPVMAITAWVGQVVDERAANPRILTLWQMTKEVPDGEEETGMWTSVLAGADEFRRGGFVAADGTVSGGG